MKKLSLPVLAFAVLGISSQALALNRCLTDRVVSGGQAWGRVQWAKRCAQENPYGYSSSTGRDTRFWHPMFNAQVEEIASYGGYAYPVYWDPTTNQPWVGPGAVGSPTASYPGAQLAGLSCTIKPAHVFVDGLCES